MEHVLDPRAKSTVDKVSDDTALDVLSSPRAQWLLGRSDHMSKS